MSTEQTKRELARRVVDSVAAASVTGSWSHADKVADRVIEDAFELGRKCQQERDESEARERENLWRVAEVLYRTKDGLSCYVKEEKMLQRSGPQMVIERPVSSDRPKATDGDLSAPIFKAETRTYRYAGRQGRLIVFDECDRQKGGA